MAEMSEEEFKQIDQFVSQKSLVEPVINAQNLWSIYQCPDQQLYRARVQFLFSLEPLSFDEETREALIDMVHGAILFASDNDFAYPKAIVFLSIYMRVFQLATQTPYYLPIELHKKYEDILLAHCIDRPPFSSQIFDLQDVKIINEFFVNTFFRNLKLILNCLAPKLVTVFKAEFPIQVKAVSLPALTDMEIVVPLPPDESPRSQAAMNRVPSTTVLPQTQPPPQLQQQTQQQSPVKAEGEEVVEDRGPEVPLDILRGSLAGMHEKFVADFEEREKQLIGKIKELEIRLSEKPQLKKPPPKKK
jgi:hypothetical protein